MVDAKAQKVALSHQKTHTQKVTARDALTNEKRKKTRKNSVTRRIYAHLLCGVVDWEMEYRLQIMYGLDILYRYLRTILD
jgi:hypothetical protein